MSLLITAVNAASAQTKVGIKAGVNFSNIMMRDENGNKMNTQSVPAILLGLTVDIPIAGDFYIQPAVQYSHKRVQAGNRRFLWLRQQLLKLMHLI